MENGVASQLIGIAIPTLRELRATTLACLSSGPSGSADAVDALRAAGFAGGDAVYRAFELWLQETGAVPGASSLPSAPDLALDEFAAHAADYFRAAGWGLVQFGSEDNDGVATVAVENCWETDPTGSEELPSCHLTTGMLAAFFGKLAGYPVAVMETECRSTGAGHCRFLLGNPEVMAFKWKGL